MSQITVSQRYTINCMLKVGHKQKEIAAEIGVHPSSVSREIKRNCDGRNGTYRAELAQKKSDERHKSKAKRIRFTAGIKGYVEKKLGEKYSPEQIAGEAKKKGLECVSVERIYQYIWADKRQGGRLYENLRTEGKRYRKRGAKKDKRGIIKEKVSIDERPKVVEDKERIGDLEIDTIIGKNHKGAILTINDRVTGMVKIRKLAGKDAKELAKVAVDALQDWKPFLHTITSDNGKEFADHKSISDQLNIDFFFAHPYHSWERGANENLNGLIRQYIPKRSDFDDFDDQFIQFVEDQLNNRPRKRFNFDTPINIFNQK